MAPEYTVSDDSNTIAIIEIGNTIAGVRYVKVARLAKIANALHCVCGIETVGGVECGYRVGADNG